MAQCILRIALDTPLNAVFDYRWQYQDGAEGADGARPQVGQLALVPFARTQDGDQRAINGVARMGRLD
eukprot:gene4219-5382_t